MRSAKKRMSLVLAVVMTAGLMAVPTQAATPKAYTHEELVLAELGNRYAEYMPFAEGLAAAQSSETYLWGFIDKSGKEVIPCKYDFVSSFSEGLARVGVAPEGIDSMVAMMTAKYGYIDKTGKLVIPMNYEFGSESFSEGLALVQTHNGEGLSYGFIDHTGRMVIPAKYRGDSTAHSFSEGLAYVVQDDYKGIFIDKTGKMVIALEDYDHRVGTFSEGFAVTKNGYIDKTGKLVIPYSQYGEDSLYGSDFKNGVAIITTYSVMGDFIIDKKGNKLPFSNANNIYGFSNGYAVFAVNVDTDEDVKRGLVDTTGNIVIPAIYDDLGNACEGLCGASNGARPDFVPSSYLSGNYTGWSDTSTGYVDTSNNVIISFDYAVVGDFSDGAAFVEKKDGTHAIIKNPLTDNMSQGGSAATSTASSFTDVSVSAYYADAVKWAVDKEITAGTSATTFSPNDTCTNSQILTFLWRAKGQPEPTIANPFTDVKDSDYFYKAAVWAYENGMVSGNVFSAATPCTRSATVTYLWKLAGSPEQAPIAGLTDVNSSAEYAKAVAWAIEKGITAGTSKTTFSPDTTCTRGQIATFLYRDMGK